MPAEIDPRWEYVEDDPEIFEAVYGFAPEDRWDRAEQSLDWGPVDSRDRRPWGMAFSSRPYQRTVTAREKPCASSPRGRLRGGEVLLCEAPNCKIRFYARPSRVNGQGVYNQRFCSRECRLHGVAAECDTLPRPCRYCRNIYQPPRGRNLYCSQLCAAKDAIQKRKEAREAFQLTGEVRTNLTTVKCGQCGVDFSYIVMCAKRKYCSLDCSRAKARADYHANKPKTTRAYTRKPSGG